MPQPTSSDVHVNVPLTTFSVAYIQGADRYISDRVFPNIPVRKQGDRYWTYDKNDFFREEVEVRAPGTESTGSGYRVDNTPTYYCDVYATHKDIDDQTRADTDDPLNTDRDATIFVTSQMMLKRDKLWAAEYFVTGIWATEREGVNAAPSGSQFLQRDDAASTPIEDVKAAVVAQVELTGFQPNTLVLSPEVYNKLTDHPDILDRIKYTQRGIVTADLLAALFGVDRVLIAWATNSTAVEGASAAMDFVFGKHALLCYANPNPSIMMPSAGYTFSWTDWFGASGIGHRIKRFRMENIESDRIEAQMAFDFKLVSSDCGYFFKTAVA